MRTRFLRATSLRLIIGLLASGPILSAWAEDGAVPGPASLQADSPAIPLPDLPMPAVVLDRGDVTGSIPDPRKPQSTPVVPFAQPPALPFDDQAVSIPVQATTSEMATAPAAQTIAPASLTAPIEPTPPLDAASKAEPPRSAADVRPQGLDNAALGAAIPAFVAARLDGDTHAQADERRKLREQIAAFYAARANVALWIGGTQLTPVARTVLDRLDHAAEDGLDLRGFAVPVPRNGEPDALTRAELAVSEAVVAYARQASGSRVDVAKIAGLIDMRPEIADVARVLSTVPNAADAGAALQAFNPLQPGYAALREKLAAFRLRGPEARNQIPSGPILKAGMSDARIPLIRARFGLDVLATDAAPALVYDAKIAAAVADFQRDNGLPPSGILTPRTVAVLSSGDPARLENTLLANMEEWRWLPHDLGRDHVEVNIPDYTVRVIRDGAVTHSARVVVGQSDHPTPVFSQVIKFIIVNPYWNVPLSIIRKEMLPKLAADPNYFANHGYETVERNGTTYVRQPPGDDNALGRIKFMFPNEHSVYLHDTNARSVFARDKRALSHGCVRVDKPFAFAEAVLGRDNGWTEARVTKLIGGTERTINLPEPLPIHIVYFTAFVDPQSGLQLRDDVYGYTGKIKLALGLPE